MIQKFHLSLERWPLLVLIADDDPTDEDIDGMFRQYEAVFARKERFAALTDARRVRKIPNAIMRAKIGAWVQNKAPLVLEFSVGHATVITNPIARGGMTAINWLHKATVPQAYFGTMLGACDWCIGQLRAGGVPLSPALETYRTALTQGSV
jgi:hypothetical protein